MHGANWTFTVLGALNAIYFLPIMLTKNNPKNLNTVAQGKYFPTLRELLQIILTFCLAAFAWIVFRAEIGHALSYIIGIFSSENFFNTIPKSWGGRMISDFTFSLLSIVLLIIIEWFGRNNHYGIEFLDEIKFRIIRWSIYILLVLYIITFVGGSPDFICFQF